MRRVLIAIMLLALAAPVAAQQRSQAKPVGDLSLEFLFEQDALESAVAKGTEPEHARRTIIKYLGLTEDQIAAWDELLETARAEAGPIRDLIRANNEELKALLDAGDPDPAAVGDLVIANVDLHRQLGDIHRSYVEGFHGLLDEQQMGRLNLVRRAARVQPVIPAFRLFGLIGPR
jgi:Spy/CpxP family protein refolding chaperone